MEASPAPTPIIPPADDKPPKRVKLEEAKSDATKTEAGKERGYQGPGTTSTKSGVPTKFHRELAEFMSLPALLFEVTGQTYPAYVWNLRITKHAYAWGDLAEKNPNLKRKLQKLMEGGSYGALIISGLGVAVPIMAYYGLYPKGMVNPFALSPEEMGEYKVMMENGSIGATNPFEFFMGSTTDDEGATPYPVS